MTIDKKPWQRLLYEIWASVTEGHAFEVEPLSVTENDTYTAPEGKAYSPVTVNVSSDFSTATVTLILEENIPEGNYYISGAFAETADNVGFDGSVPAAYFEDEPRTSTAILYKGLAVGTIYNDDPTEGVKEAIATVTGNATIDGGYVEITGDCTITVTGVANE